MIRIVKGAVPPKLAVAGVARSQRHCNDYDIDPAAYQAGRLRFEFVEGVYGHASVRAALWDSHYGKCCYCEARIEKPYALAHVEHWRPKGCSQQSAKTEEVHPGYYWLAYHWDNLFLSCHFCNSANKRTVFPLFNPARRARTHHENLAVERPKLLKPDVDEPRHHIAFHREIPKGITARGKETVRVLGLDSAKHEGWRTLWESLQRSHEYLNRFHADPHPAAAEIKAAARALIDAAILPNAPFSAMAIAFVETHPIPI